MREQLVPELADDPFARLGGPPATEVRKQTVKGVTADDGEGRGDEDIAESGPLLGDRVEGDLEDVGDQQQEDGSDRHDDDGRHVPDALPPGHFPEGPVGDSQKSGSTRSGSRAVTGVGR